MAYKSSFLTKCKICNKKEFYCNHCSKIYNSIEYYYCTLCNYYLCINCKYKFINNISV